MVLKDTMLCSILGIVLMTALGECGHRESGRELKVSKDAASLAKLINLPHQPKEVSWETVNLGGPDSNDWVLIAVITFEGGVVDEIIGHSRLSGSGVAPS